MDWYFFRQMQHLMTTHVWWAIRNAYKAQFFMNVYYEKEWETNITELRERLNIEEPPYTPAKMKQSYQS